MKKNFLSNWKSGLTVSIVSIPLSLALAITSGATPTQGIITAFWAGLLGALFASNNYNIIGPTGALAGVLLSFALSHGFGVLPFIAIFAGIFIFVAYLFKWDRYIIFIPQSVIHGFTLGVAFIIAFGQLSSVFGIYLKEKSESFIGGILLIFKNLDQANWTVFFFFFLSTLFIYFWNKKMPKVPGAAVVAFFAIIVMLLLDKFGINPDIVTIGDKYSSLHATLFTNNFSNFDIKLLFQKDVLVISIATAVIAILETLLSGQIASKMTKTKFDRRKEVLGLSIANIGSGLCGGIPATAALARTTLNIKSGANHRTSAFINAIFVGIISLFFIEFFKLIPMAIIASILVIVAIGMVEKNHFIYLINNEKVSFFLFMFVAVIVVLEDPIAGIIIGSIVALLIFVKKVSRGQTEVLVWKDGELQGVFLKNDFIKEKEVESDMIVYKISGTLTYINMPAHLKAVNEIRDNEHIIISLRNVFYADIDGVGYLSEIVEVLKNNGNKHIFLSGVNKEVKRLISKEKFYKKKLAENKIYKRTSDAITEIKNKKDIQNL